MDTLLPLSLRYDGLKVWWTIMIWTTLIVVTKLDKARPSIFDILRILVDPEMVVMTEAAEIITDPSTIHGVEIITEYHSLSHRTR
jgi:hypothetical protein